MNKKTLVCVFFETGDCTVPQWMEVIVIDGLAPMIYREIECAIATVNESEETDDFEYSEILEKAMQTLSYNWHWFNGNECIDCVCPTFVN